MQWRNWRFEPWGNLTEGGHWPTLRKKLRNNSESGIKRLYKNTKSRENARKQPTETKRIENTSKLRPVFIFRFPAGTAPTLAPRQLCHWSRAFQTRTATSLFDRVTHNNRYDSANAGRTIVGMRLGQTSCWDSWKLVEDFGVHHEQGCVVGCKISNSDLSKFSDSRLRFSKISDSLR